MKRLHNSSHINEIDPGNPHVSVQMPRVRGAPHAPLSPLAMGFSSSHPSPAAMRQLEPFGWLIMIVQVEPLSLVRTLTSEPLLESPTATGSSLKRLFSSFRR